jgi:hypothetical protein
MARRFSNGIDPGLIPALPDPVTVAGTIIRQGGKLWYSDGQRWLELVKITVSATAPPSPVAGDLWVDTN